MKCSGKGNAWNPCTLKSFSFSLRFCRYGIRMSELSPLPLYHPFAHTQPWHLCNKKVRSVFSIFNPCPFIEAATRWNSFVLVFWFFWGFLFFFPLWKLSTKLEIETSNSSYITEATTKGLLAGRFPKIDSQHIFLTPSTASSFKVTCPFPHSISAQGSR